MFSRRYATFAFMMMLAPSAHAVPLLSLGDPILAIDIDSPMSASSYPAAENPPKVLDANSSTKYLNFAAANSGFIITPVGGPLTVQSIVLTTANDHEERDPASYALYGTNEAIISADNSPGIAENWTLISAGSISLPTTRLTKGSVISFASATPYTSFRLVFPTLKNVLATSMQIADVAFYGAADGTGTNILTSAATIKAIDMDVLMGNYASAEVPAYAIDTTTSFYRNLGGVNSGFIVTPWVGPTVVDSMVITTSSANSERDPSAWAIYGTNDTILSTDNSAGNLENWTLIAYDAIDLPTTRNTAGSTVSFTNTTAYKSYRVLFTAVRNPATAVGMQIGEIQLYGTILSFVPAALLAPTDPILGTDLDFTATSASNYPATEPPAMVLDGNSATKYLNFAQANSGFIVTPVFSPSVIQSMVLTTANDELGRDPASFALYGTNDAIVSANNSLGVSENWTLIAKGALNLPDARLTAGPVVSFTNAASYTSYKLLFPSVKNKAANSMQIADVAFLDAPDGTGANFLTTMDNIRAVDADPGSTSSSPAGEGVINAINGTLAKYLNNGKVNSGFVVTPAVGACNVTSFRLVSANDFPERDPVAWSLYGTNDTITMANDGVALVPGRETWTLISSGPVATPLARFTAAPIVSFTNSSVYTSYLIVFTALRDSVLAGSMQIGEIQFYGKVGKPCPTPFADADADGDVDQSDFGIFQACFTGDGIGTVAEVCKCFDTGASDNDVDGYDLAAFANCWTGPSILWTPALTPNCVP